MLFRSESEYPFFEVENAKITGLKMKGKYSFQYDRDIEISDSKLDTKDAFWHTKNVTVKNSVIKSEYLGWYSENLTLLTATLSEPSPSVTARILCLKIAPWKAATWLLSVLLFMQMFGAKSTA